MADLTPVSPGEPFRFLDADVANALLDMARDYRNGSLGRLGGLQTSAPQGDPVSVVVQNRTGSALDQYGVVGFSDALVPYATSATEFKRRPQFRATTPTATGPFGIVQQPLANWVSDSTPKTIGRAVVAGCTVCKLNIGDSSHTHASPTTSTTELTTGTSGPARILAKESGTGSGKWGLVLITNSGSGGGSSGGGCCGDESNTEYHATDAPWETTFEIRRPFGAGSATTSNIDCTWFGDFAQSRLTPDALDWTAVLVCPAATDIRDGCTRLAGSNALTYADGDEVRIPSGASSPRFVVVWVEPVNKGESGPDLYEYKRVYLMRNTA